MFELFKLEINCSSASLDHFTLTGLALRTLSDGPLWTLENILTVIGQWSDEFGIKSPTVKFDTFLRKVELHKQ